MMTHGMACSRTSHLARYAAAVRPRSKVTQVVLDDIDYYYAGQIGRGLHA